MRTAKETLPKLIFMFETFIFHTAASVISNLHDQCTVAHSSQK
jgi:hypothetical protein